MEKHIVDNKIKKIIDKYPDLWSKKSYKKGKIFISENDIVTHNYYIESGIIKASIFDEHSNAEAIIEFFAEWDCMLFCGDINLSNNNEALANFEVIENAILYSIDSTHWETIRKEENLDELAMLNLAKILKKFITKAKINLLPTAKERYKETLKYYPFLERIKDKDIAEYLGITERTVTNIRHKHNKN